MLARQSTASAMGRGLWHIRPVLARHKMSQPVHIGRPIWPAQRIVLRGKVLTTVKPVVPEKLQPAV